MDWDKSEWFWTPTKSFADMTALAQLPKVKLKVQQHAPPGAGAEVVTTVNLTNPSKTPGLLRPAEGRPRAPGATRSCRCAGRTTICRCCPGEKRTVTATYRTQDLGSAWPVAVELSGLNLAP